MIKSNFLIVLQFLLFQTELALKTSNKNLFAAIQAINQRLYASDTEVERLKAEQKCFEDIIQEVSSTFSKFQVIN